MIGLQERYLGCLLGLACGDAVGTTAEFAPRGSFLPVTGMDGGGPFGLQPGQWTDDTSMALCLAESLLERDGFDLADQLRSYVRWWQHGHLSSTGECFDIGSTVAGALYGVEAIPLQWLVTLHQAELIGDFALRIFDQTDREPDEVAR